jgi:hypothetical protein
MQYPCDRDVLTALYLITTGKRKPNPKEKRWVLGRRILIIASLWN